MELKDLNIDGYERVVEAQIAPDVTAIISIHNLKRGPSLGGCRFYNYTSKEAALTDVLRLSEGMSYKSAMAELPLGGGKSVIIGDPRKVKTKELLENFGRFVNELNGQYITAKDVGVEVEDLDVMATQTKWVRGTSDESSSGDPSPVTAFGVFQGIRAAANFQWGNASVKGKRVVVQGLGHVGLETAKHLLEDGAEVWACELNQEALEKAAKNYGIKAIGLDEWKSTEADIFCPCAMGAILTPETIPQLQSNGVKVIAGGANNQLLDIVEDGQRVKDAGMLYAPDYIINAGGVINIACEIMGYDSRQAIEMTSKIYDTTTAIFERAKKENRPTAVVSLDMAREKLGLK
ncbi:MAG: amino acid dehydrogenase [Deltaproteobacteria bacterium]|nr:amino acid dehydrogenase [Deltaproteobacteria bacterium]